MLGSTAPLTRAARKARASLEHTAEEIQDDIQTASRLRDISRWDERDAERHGAELPEELSPGEADEVLEEEYRPLMEDESGAEEGRQGQAGKGRRTARGESSEVKVRKLEVWVAYGVFFILGAAILLGWNQIIVASSYFAARLKDSPFENSFASFVSLTFTTANLLFLARANATQAGANLARRISTSILVMTANLVVFIVTTRVKDIDPYLFFAFLIVSAVILAGSASYLQNAVVALSASFGPSYLNQILSGQGAIGFAVAMIQFIAAYGAVKASHKSSSSSSPSLRLRLQPDFNLAYPADSLLSTTATPPDSVRTSAFTFFLTIGIFAAVSWLSYALLVRLPIYRLVIRSSFDVDDDACSTTSAAAPLADMRQVERKVRHLGVAMFIVFGVTLSVFPSITATIVSVKTDLPDARMLQNPALFVPLGFAVFAGGDWLGRVLPQWEKLQFTNWKVLMGCSVARIVFIPLFLICNQTAGGSKQPVINSDLLFFTIMLLFAISNGYISTLVMLASVVEPSLDEHEIDIAATCLAFYLTLGLAAGSFLSFGVRASVCRCNPFT
ncbi:hypothetical protein JCM10207_006910 [Rhodosporidiobolus poonsookiae]